jgi:hypothetical protein
MLSSELGMPVQPDDLWDNNYPEARYLDAARWGASLRDNTRSVQVHSWDTMGECVRNGFTIIANYGTANVFQVSAVDG